MKRLILHWTAGHYVPSESDLSHYHYIIDGNGKTHRGKWPVSANAHPVQGRYAAHTLNCNTGSIGVAVAAMAGAQERPFLSGVAPIKQVQIDALARLCADLCEEYGITVDRHSVLTHAEVQPTLSIKQRGKWDIAWLPGMDKPGDPVMVGDVLRAKVKAAHVNKTPKTEHVADDMLTPPLWTLPYGNPLADFIAGVIAAILKIMGVRK